MFTQQVQEEVRKVNKLDNKAPKSANNGTNSGTQSGGVVIVTGVAKKKVQKQKGELIEQNQDGLEYSSEEEGENLHETAAGIANKQKRELAKVDHATTDYQPFRKSFYVEVPEIGMSLYAFLYDKLFFNYMDKHIYNCIYFYSKDDTRRSRDIQGGAGRHSRERQRLSETYQIVGAMRRNQEGTGSVEETRL